MTSVSVFEGWEGRTVGGKFPLLEWLGGSADRGVFLTVRQGTQTACIKLVLAGGPQADAYLAQWEAAKPLSHPNLVSVLESGRCTIDGKNLVYVLTDRAEAALSGITPRKALDPDKAREILDRVLDALSYIHEKGFIHGHIKPSNILLVADEWKLSADSLRTAGEGQKARHESDTYDAPEVIEGRLTAAADVWSLGMTMAESLMARPPAWDESTPSDPAVRESVLEPFLEIVRGCLRSDPDKRCTIAEIKARLVRDASASIAAGRAAEAAAPALAEVEPMRVVKEPASVAAEPVSAVPESAKVVEHPIPPTIDQLSVATTPAPAEEETIGVTAEPVSVAPEPESIAVEPSGAGEEAALEEIAVVAESSASVDAQSGRVESGVDHANEQVNERVDQPVDDHFEPAPSSRMLANLEKEEHVGGFKMWRLLFGVVVLLAIVAVFLVRSHRIRLPFPLMNRNAPAASQAAAKPEAQKETKPPATPAEGAPQPESAVVPPTQSARTTEQTGQAGQPVQTGQPTPESQPPAASAAGESKSGPAISPAVTGPVPTSPAATGKAATSKATTTKAEPQAPASPEVANEANSEGAVVKQVLPRVSPGAVSSMRGPVEVEVRVSVNKEGTVSNAEYVSNGPGNYFARISHDAARSWKFRPPETNGQPRSSVWTLQFQFDQEKTGASAVQLR